MLSARRPIAMEAGAIPVADMLSWGRIVLGMRGEWLREFVVIIASMDSAFLRLSRERSPKAKSEPGGAPSPPKPNAVAKRS